MTEFQVFVGLDWGSESHVLCALDAQRKELGRRAFAHSGPGMAEMLEWIASLGPLSEIAVSIETSRGTVVETLLARELAVFAINPKQLDRFRDRHTAAGSKDDRLDAFVLADSLRTDLHVFRRVQLDDEHSVRLRELGREEDEIKQDLRRLTNQLREQLLRYFPALLKLSPGADEPWLWRLLEKAPTPASARRLGKGRLIAILGRVRRITPDDLQNALREMPVHVAPGVLDACSARVKLLLGRIAVTHTAYEECQDAVAQALDEASEPAEGQKSEHRDAKIVRSLPGAGRSFAAAMLGEARQAIRERDYQSLRASAGVAPVTWQSGKSRLVRMRRSVNQRIRSALHMAMLGLIRNDPIWGGRYREARSRGKPHNQAVRVVGDQLLRVLIGMLKEGTVYDPGRLANAS